MKTNKIVPRLSVTVITYNQEDVIRRALDSLVKQINYIYEICVSDDCSKDSTWDILLEYKKEYPSVFNIHQNDPNLGIFQNVEQSWTMPTGDVVYQMAGDDEVPAGWFKTVYEFLDGIDWKNERFCIYSNHQCVYPNGDTFEIKKNGRADLESGLLKQYEYGLLNGRGSCFSIEILKCFKKCSKGRSYIAENAQDGQLHFFTEKAYYIPQIGNIYYSGIGVSSAMMADERRLEHESTMLYAFEFFKGLGEVFTPAYSRLPQFNIAQKRFRFQHSLKNYLSVIKTYITSLDWSVCIRNIDVRRFVFRIVRRLPHKRPITW